MRYCQRLPAVSPVTWIVASCVMPSVALAPVSLISVAPSLGGGVRSSWNSTRCSVPLPAPSYTRNSTQRAPSGRSAGIATMLPAAPPPEPQWPVSKV